MQPLYSVDHETRQNSCRVEDTTSSPVREETPLLQRFPQISAERPRSMMITVSLLLILLVSGIIIGIYLLVLQSHSENVLPPVDTPIQLVSRKQWHAVANKQPVSLDGAAANKASQINVLHADAKITGS